MEEVVRVRVHVKVEAEVQVDAMGLRGRRPERGGGGEAAFWTEIPKTLPMLTMHISIFYRC